MSILLTYVTKYVNNMDNDMELELIEQKLGYSFNYICILDAPKFLVLMKKTV